MSAFDPLRSSWEGASIWKDGQVGPSGGRRLEVRGIPRDQRVAHLRARLKPELLLAALDAATLPDRPFVELIGIKAQTDESKGFESEAVPEFKEHLQSDPAITEQIRPYVAMGFRFRWTGYFDPTGIECSLAIERNPEAERKLREWIEGTRLEDRRDRLPLL